jgi:hypothetical protein
VETNISSGLPIATTTIFVRSVFRVAELSGGFHGKLANQEITFMVLEGAMIIVAVVILTVLHPLFAFGSAWTDAGWSFRSKPKEVQEWPVDMGDELK